MSLCEQRDRIRQQVELLQRRLCASNSELQQLSSDSDGESGEDTDLEAPPSVAGLLAQRQKIETEIQNLENILGPHSPVSVSDGDDDDDGNSSGESELGLSTTVDSCLQMNLVYQQILQEKLKRLEILLAHNQRQQKEAVSQLSGPIREASKEEPASSSAYPKHGALFLGHFLKPYFKSKVTGLGPPANQDAKEKMMKMKGCLDNSKMKVKRWESWQKTLLINSVSKDGLRRLLQPKLSRLDYLTQKLSSSDKSEDEKQQLKAHIEILEKDIESIKLKKEEELVGDQNEYHDWHKIANIDFEGLRQADDLRLFWQNFLHPSINKNRWSAEEVQKLKEVSARNQETNWDLIAKELRTGRTAFMCLQTFQRFISSSLKRGAWTPAEDQKLTQMVEKMRIGNFIPYTQICYFMEGRDTPQLIYRWSSVLDPQLKKGTWSTEEDQLLLRAVARHGEKRWWKIRLEVPGRTDGACRDRYLDCLKEGTRRGAFDLYEQQLLLQLLDKHGAGRWAKIAAEIPHRNDAQCLREWKKMMRRAKEPLKIRQRIPKTSQETKTMKNEKTKLRASIRRRLQRIKEEEDSSQEDEDEVKYVDTGGEDEEQEESSVDSKCEEDEPDDGEEDKDYYPVPPMHEWIPQEESPESSFRRARLVTLEPASADPLSGPTAVRSTVVAEFGRSVVVGPPPRRLSWEERHAGGAMLMMSQEQLHSHLCHQANKYNKLRPRRHPPKKGHVTVTEMDYMLQAAVLPWVGNVLVPSPATPTLADALGDKTTLSSTPVFRLLLRAMTVDVSGCKDVIVRRGCDKLTPSPWRPLLPRPPPPKPELTPALAPPCLKNPKTVAAMLYTNRARPPDAGPAAVMQQAPPAGFLPHAPPSICLVTTPPLLPKAPLALRPFQVQSQTWCRLPFILPCAPPRPPPPSIWLLTTPPLSGGLSGPAHPSLPTSPLSVHLVSPPLLAGPVRPSLTATPLAPPPLDYSSAAPTSAPSGSVTLDHDYSSPAPKPPPTRRKRGCEEDSGGRTHTNVGKRIRKSSQKAQWARSTASSSASGAPWARAPPPAGGSSPAPPRRAGLNVDPSLVFSGSPVTVADWLIGLGGVAVPELGVSLPYLPPCSSSLNALAAVLADKTKNASAARQLVQRTTQATPSRLPEDTADETMCLLRSLVRERLGSNPAYRLLKARFLSVFALPALLATLRPVATSTSSRTPEVEKKVKNAKQRTQKHNGWRKFSCDGSGAPANHFSGISATGPAQPRPSEAVSNQ
ncbi:snRNA-activating protein complex subunit 4 isoform X1 [Phycodurus eques]|uniref:snRNA-activating protein complex subunit 4 isoform X1 n=1 Tax=Phycodurus eques TaxID=693459 RepID=UPI002ACD6E5A|nr:snRNA-activating protein complex subunit 4 isoform X1 [Phycodurus eques]XP_061527188.1 snRNA-activating protein complex subunit 4 isoform X1 [Phycodurus eques]